MLDSEQLTANQKMHLVDSFNELIHEGYVPEILITISTLQTLLLEHIHESGQHKLTPIYIHSIERLRMLFDILHYPEK